MNADTGLVWTKVGKDLLTTRFNKFNILINDLGDESYKVTIYNMAGDIVASSWNSSYGLENAKIQVEKWLLNNLDKLLWTEIRPRELTLELVKMKVWLREYERYNYVQISTDDQSFLIDAEFQSPSEAMDWALTKLKHLMFWRPEDLEFYEDMRFDVFDAINRVTVSLWSGSDRLGAWNQVYDGDRITKEEAILDCQRFTVATYTDRHPLGEYVAPAK